MNDYEPIRGLISIYPLLFVSLPPILRPRQTVDRYLLLSGAISLWSESIVFSTLKRIVYSSDYGVCRKSCWTAFTCAWFRLALVLSLFVFGINSVWALPEGYQSVSGDVQFSQPDANTLNAVTQANQSIVNYNSFNIGGNETVNLNLPSASSVMLNRVVGGNPSEILGRLNSNGQIFLVNPSGIIFGQGAQVNVAGLTASTLSISDSDFLAGNYHFYAPPGSVMAGVTNQGTLTASNYVNLFGGSVDNSGVIQASEANLVVGNSVQLAINPSLSLEIQVDEGLKSKVQGVQDAIKNSGSITANNVHLLAELDNALYDKAVNQTGVIKAVGFGQDKGGNVVVLGRDSSGNAMVYNTGSIDASSQTGAGGTIQLLGDLVAHDGTLDASGSTGGGTVLIGGDYQGLNPNVYNASKSWIGLNGVVKANALNSGDGGKIIVWADDSTQVYGHLNVSGIDRGGFVETSGKQFLDVSGTPDISATSGVGGTWLIDPNDITIVAGGGNTNINGTNPFNTSADGASLGVNLITAALASGNVSISTGTAGANAGNGDITLSTNLNYTGVGGRTLTLNAHRNINVNGSITSTNALNINLQADSDANLTGNIVSNASGSMSTAGGSITLNGVGVTTGAGLTTSGGDITVNAKSGGAALNAAVNTGVGNIGVTTISGGNVTLGSTINTTSGSLTVNSAGSIAVNGAMTSSSSGNIGLNATTTNTISSNVSTTSGSVTATGTNVTATGDLSSGAPGITVNSSGAVSLSDLTASNGTINLDAVTTMVLNGTMNAGTGVLDAQSGGNLSFGGSGVINTNGTVNLTSTGGSISLPNAGNLITTTGASNVNLSANTTIATRSITTGTGFANFTAPTSVTVTHTAGNTMRIGTATTPSLTVSSSGNNGSILVNGAFTGTTFNLSTSGSNADITTNNTVNASTTLSMTTSNNGSSITAANALTGGNVTLTTAGTTSGITVSSGGVSGANVNITTTSNTSGSSPIAITGNVSSTGTMTVSSSGANVGITGDLNHTGAGAVVLRAGLDGGANVRNNAATFTVGGNVNIAGAVGKSFTAWIAASNTFFSEAYFTDNSLRTFATLDFRNAANNSAINFTSMDGLNLGAVTSLTVTTQGNTAPITLGTTFTGTTLNLQTNGTGSGITTLGTTGVTNLTLQTTGTTSPIAVTGNLAGTNMTIQTTVNVTNSPVTVTGNITSSGNLTLQSYGASVTVNGTGNITNTGGAASTVLFRAGIDNGGTVRNTGATFTLNGTLNITGNATKSFTAWVATSAALYAKAYFTDGSARSFGTLSLFRNANNEALSLASLTGLSMPTTNLTLITGGTNAPITVGTSFNGTALNLQARNATDATSPITLTGNITATGALTMESYRGNVTVNGTGNITHTGTNTVSLRAGFNQNSSSLNTAATFTLNGALNVSAGAGKTFLAQIGNGASLFGKAYFSDGSLRSLGTIDFRQSANNAGFNWLGLSGLATPTTSLTLLTAGNNAPITFDTVGPPSASITLQTQGTSSSISLPSGISGTNIDIRATQNTDTTSSVSFGGDVTATGSAVIASARGNVTFGGNFTQTGSSAVQIYGGYDTGGTLRDNTATSGISIAGTFSVTGAGGKNLTINSSNGSIFSNSFFTDGSNRTFGTIDFRRSDSNGTFNFPTLTGVNQNPATTLTLITQGSNGSINVNGYTSGTNLNLTTTGAGSNIVSNGSLNATNITLQAQNNTASVNVTGNVNGGNGTLDLQAGDDILVTGNVVNTSTTGTSNILAGRNTLTTSTDLNIGGTLSVGQGTGKSFQISDGDGSEFSDAFFNSGTLTFATFSPRSGTDTDFGSTASPWQIDAATLTVRTLGNAYFTNSSANLNINNGAGNVSGTYQITSSGNVTLNSGSALAPGRLYITTTTAGNTIGITGTGAVNAADILSFTTNNGDINITSGNLSANNITLNAGTANVNISGGRTVTANSTSSNLTYTNSGINVGGNYLAGLRGQVAITGTLNNSGAISAQGSSTGSITINYTTADLNLNNVTLRTSQGLGGLVNVNGTIYQNGTGTTGITTAAGSAGGTGTITINMGAGRTITGDGTTIAADNIQINGNGNVTLTDLNANSTASQNYVSSNGNITVSGNLNSDLVNFTASNGSISATETTNSLNLGTMSAGNAATAISNTGSVDFSLIESVNNQTITITAATTIDDKDDVGNNLITNGTAALTANGAIGGTTPLNTNVGTLTLNTPGNATISEANNLVMGTSSVNNLNMTLAGGGNLTSTGTTTASTMNITTTGNVGASGASRFATTAGTINLTNVTNAYINETDALTIGSTALTTMDILAGGNLISSGTITATNVLLDTTANIGSSTASRFNTNTTNLTLGNAANAYINETDGVALGSTSNVTNLDLVAAGNVTSNSAVQATTATINTGGGNLGTSNASRFASTIGTLNLSNAPNAYINETDALTIGSTALTTMDILAGGNLISSGTITATNVLLDTTANIGTSTASRFNTTTTNLTLGNAANAYINETDGVVLATSSNVTNLDMLNAGNVTSSGTVQATTATINTGGGNLGTSSASRFNSNIGTLNLSNTPNAYINETNGITLGSSTAMTNMDVTAAGNVLSSGTVEATNLTVNTTGDIGVSPASRFNSRSSNITVSGNNAYINEFDGATVATSSSLNTLDMVAGGNLVSSGTVAATNLLLDTTGNVGSSTASRFNTNTANLTLKNTPNAYINETDAMAVATTTNLTNLDVTAGGNLTSSGTVQATTMNLTTTGNIGASTASRFNTTTTNLTVGAVNAYINETDGASIATASALTTLDVSAGGNLTSSGTVQATNLTLDTTGTVGSSTASRFNTNTANFNLNNANSAFISETDGLTLGVTNGSGTVDVLAGNSIVISGANVGAGNLVLDNRPSAGSVTQTGSIQAGTLTVNTRDGSVTLTNTSNDVGTFSANTNNQNVAYTDANSVVMAASNVGTGNMTLTTQGTGTLAQTGSIQANQLSVTTGSGNVTLTNAANNVSQLNATSTGNGNVTYTDADGLAVGPVSIGTGTLTVNAQSTGNIAVAGTVTAGTASLTTNTGSITQTQAIQANNLNITTSGGNTTLNHASNAVNQATFATTGHANYSQNGDLSIAGSVSGTLNASTQGDLSTHGALSANQLNLSVGANGDMTVNHALNTANNVTLQTNGSGQLTVGVAGSVTATNRTITLQTSALAANGSINAGPNGTIIVKPTDTTSTVGIGGGVGTFNLNTTTLGNMNAGQLTVGDATSSGSISVDTMNMAGKNMSVTLNTTGTIVDATPAVDAAANITIDSGRTLTLTGGGGTGTAQIGASGGLADLDVDLGNSGLLQVKTNNASAYINAQAGNLTLGTVDVGNAAVQLTTDNGSILNGASVGIKNLYFGSNSYLAATGGATRTLGTDTTALVIESSNPNVQMTLIGTGQTNGVTGHFNVTNAAIQFVTFTGPGQLIFGTNLLVPPSLLSNGSSSSGLSLSQLVNGSNGAIFLFNPMQNPVSGDILGYVEEQLSPSPMVPQVRVSPSINPYYRLAQFDTNREDSKRLKSAPLPTNAAEGLEQADDEEKRKKPSLLKSSLP